MSNFYTTHNKHINMNQPAIPMADPSLYTEEEVASLVHNFYAKARKDPSLGPIFEAHVIDWDAHFVQMTNFWSAQLRGTSRFRGAPMPKHIVLPDLSAALFERWIELFKETTQEMGNPGLKLHADTIASFIANRLWQGYQLSNHPNEQPTMLSC